MGTVNQKIRFTKLAVDDIELALNEKGVSTEGAPLSVYGNLIRTLGNGGAGKENIEYEPKIIKHIGYERIEEYYIAKPIEFRGMVSIDDIDDDIYLTEYFIMTTPVRVDYTIG